MNEIQYVRRLEIGFTVLLVILTLTLGNIAIKFLSGNFEYVPGGNHPVAGSISYESITTTEDRYGNK
jgi:hypothetical protein